MRDVTAAQVGHVGRQPLAVLLDEGRDVAEGHRQLADGGREVLALAGAGVGGASKDSRRSAGA